MKLKLRRGDVVLLRTEDVEYSEDADGEPECPYIRDSSAMFFVSEVSEDGEHYRMHLYDDSFLGGAWVKASTIITSREKLVVLQNAEPMIDLG